MSSPRCGSRTSRSGSSSPPLRTPRGSGSAPSRRSGDTSLYVAGFFAESLTRSLVDVDYYVGLGQTAYAQLARSLGGRKSIGEVYEELAAKFPQFVDVLAQVRKRVAIAELNATSDVQRLYDIWLRTRDEWVEKKLKQAGLLVDPGSKVIQ